VLASESIVGSGDDSVLGDTGAVNPLALEKGEE
jgi:hypothetical protein